MALSTSQVWELRTTGSDTNGGAFKAGASGTDYSVQDAAQIAVADAVANGTTTLTSATATFTAAHVGNVVYLTGGTGSLAATRREIVSFTNATTVVLDATVATGTGIALNLGGALLTFAELASATRGMVAQNKAFVKSGTYVIAAGVTFAQSSTANFSAPPSEIVGYKTVRGDITINVNAASRPIVSINTASITALTFSGNGWEVRNLVVSPGSATPYTGFKVTGSNACVHNCAVTGYVGYAMDGGSGAAVTFHSCEVSGGSGAATIGITTSGSYSPIIGCYVHDGVGSGISATGNSTIAHNVVANQSGATADGIQATNYSAVLFNTVYNAGRHGISCGGVYSGSLTIRGNILANNGGYGLTNLAGAGIAARARWDGNAFYSNTSGNRNNFDDTTVNPANAVAPHLNTIDVALSASPFTNAAGGDFTLNNTANAGALLRGTGALNKWPTLTQVGYRDFGALQHQDMGGTTTTTFIEG